MRNERRYQHMVLLLAIAAGWPLSALAAAGLVQFSAGEVNLRRGDTLGPLVRGAAVDGGDVILTGASGRAQIRFTDGGLVSLYPDSLFTVERYIDSGDPDGDHFVVNLMRGGLRAVTGLIGKRNPANYKVITPTAVVGIRGSAFRVFFNAQGQVEVAGEQDEIEVCTKVGCVGVMSGESVLVLSEQQLPVYTNTRAVLPLPQLQGPMEVGNKVQRDKAPTPEVPQEPMIPPVPVTPTTPQESIIPPAPETPGRQTLPVLPVLPTVPVLPIEPLVPSVTRGPSIL